MMKKMRKTLFGLSILCLGMGLAACGSKNSDSSKSNEGSLTVGFWKGDSTSEDSARKKAFENFEKEYNVKVVEKVYNDYDTQLMTDLVGGTAPDVFYVDASNLPSLTEKGVLEELDTYIESEKNFDTEDFYEPIFNSFKSTDGKIYGIPKDYSTLALSYNKELLSKAGLSEKDLPTDFSELENFLAKLKEKLPDVTPMVFSPLLARQMYIAQSDGGKIVTKDYLSNLNDPKVIEALQPLVDLYQKDLIKSASDLGFGWAGDAFGAQAAVLSDEGAWAISHYKTNFPELKYGTVELPKIQGKQGSMVFSVSYSMNKSSKNKENAWKLINFLTNTKTMTEYATEASVLPSRKSAAEAMKLSDNQILSPFVEAASYATPWQDGPYLSVITSQYENMIVPALKGEMTLKEAMNQATESANKDIETQMSK